MTKRQKVAGQVKQFYLEADSEFARFSWKHHLPLVVKFAEELCERFGADPELAVAGAWLHDVGDAFVDRNGMMMSMTRYLSAWLVRCLRA